MKKYISMLLVIISLFSVTIPAMAATREAPIVDAYLNWDSADTVSPCIHSTPKSGSANVLLNLSSIVPRPTTIQVRFFTDSPLWPAAKYNDTIGYIEYEWLQFKTIDDLGVALFGSNSLKSGDKGSAVYNLQGCLNLLGAKLTTDKSFGNSTVNAVKAFQRKVGLSADGIVGADTRREIVRALNVFHPVSK